MCFSNVFIKCDMWMYFLELKYVKGKIVLIVLKMYLYIFFNIFSKIRKNYFSKYIFLPFLFISKYIKIDFLLFGIVWVTVRYLHFSTLYCTSKMFYFILFVLNNYYVDDVILHWWVCSNQMLSRKWRSHHYKHIVNHMKHISFMKLNTHCTLCLWLFFCVRLAIFVSLAVIWRKSHLRPSTASLR